ncbi:MAG: hypothetical protein PHH09_13400 [Methanoregulaceae archaeon]|nr:hypothetical protein [Methanoregulaceae archaeon]
MKKPGIEYLDDPDLLPCLLLVPLPFPVRLLKRPDIMAKRHPGLCIDQPVFAQMPASYREFVPNGKKLFRCGSREFGILI